MTQQTALMKFNPSSGKRMDFAGSFASAWRAAFADDRWNFNPWTGELRADSDLSSDPTGLLIVPPGEEPEAAPGVAEQPAPKANHHPAIWPLVMVDMATRDKTGRERYGVPLQPHNGRDMLLDAYQEALDLACYLRGAIFERDGA